MILLFLLAVACPSCEEIEAILEEQRRAHLERDADLLVRHVADQLVSVDAGGVTTQTREEVRQTFAGYFEGAVYHAWEDLEPPLIRTSKDGHMAYVVRRVLSDREEPDGSGGRRRRRRVSAYTSTFERRDGVWRMTSVTSTFAPTTTTSDLPAVEP